MSQALARKNLTPASLRQTGGARSVLLRMAADDARAERVRQVKDDNPGVTWASIAEAIGVKERSAVEWARTGGISYPNAKKFAEYFHIDLDWLWRGEPATPDLMRSLDGNGSQLDRIEEMLRQLVAGQDAGVAAIAELAEAVVALQRQVAPARRAAS